MAKGGEGQVRDRREKVIAVLLLAAGSTPTPCRDRIPSNLVSLSSQFRSFLFLFFGFASKKQSSQRHLDVVVG